jgi:hypothetical protein
MSKITKSRVIIEFEASSGYESKEEFQTHPSSLPLRNALREILRVLLINNEREEVTNIVNEALYYDEEDAM